VWKKFVRSNFWIKLRNWEYWPFGIIQFPIFIYWLWLSLKARSLFFFSASNPEILTGGMMGESKFDVLKLVPDEIKPKSVLVRLPVTADDVQNMLALHQFSLPVVFKPDLGERGWMVKIIRTEADIEKYLSQIKLDSIIQELVPYPLEFGVFYVRYPNAQHGRVNSITMKEFLHVVGDGVSTLEELILAKNRAKLQWETLRHTYQQQLRTVPANGERIELVPIGNHCLGTTFLNGNHLITDKLNSSFDRISKQIKGFYFGRYDIRCASLEDLENGKIKVMELNGCGAEPAHIYHPGSSLIEAFGVLFAHWRNLYVISSQNHSRGVPYLSFREGSAIFKRFKALRSAE
jgi:hypothetical protein